MLAEILSFFHVDGRAKTASVLSSRDREVSRAAIPTKPENALQRIDQSRKERIKALSVPKSVTTQMFSATAKPSFQALDRVSRWRTVQQFVG